MCLFVALLLRCVNVHRWISDDKNDENCEIALVAFLMNLWVHELSMGSRRLSFFIVMISVAMETIFWRENG